MSAGELSQIRLDENQRADVTLIIDRLQAAGWRVYRETTRTDEPMLMEPGAGARHHSTAGEFEVEYQPAGLAVWIDGLGDREGHELLVRGCGRSARPDDPARSADGQQALENVLGVLISYQDRLTADSYAQFGEALLAACPTIEYYGDESGAVVEFDRDALTTGELPLARDE